MAATLAITGWARCSLLLLAAIVISAHLPAALRAENLVFRNDTNAPLVIQGACVVRGQLRTDQPIMMAPGAVARINLPGNKLITVYHARLPNRPLYQNTIPGGNDDLYYSIQLDVLPARVKLEQQKKPFPIPGPPGMSGPQGMTGPPPMSR
jgi:hypothetical protein